MPVPVASLQPLLAHPLTEPGRLEIPPLAAAVVAALVVASVARFWPSSKPAGPHEPTSADEVHPWAGTLTPIQVAGRALAVAMLLLAVVAGRVGSEQELRNLTPALVLGAGWPLLLLASLVVGPIWRWIDPWDGVARALDRNGDDAPIRAVWWAVVPAGLFVWYVAAYPTPYSPRSLGLALALYSVVTVAGCLALGRRRWLSGGEVFGLLFSWSALTRGGLATRWAPPVGSGVIIGVVAGGLVFATIARSDLWGRLAVSPLATLYATVGVAVVAGAFAAALWWLDRREGAGAGSASVASVPAVVGLALALSMHRDILFTSISLLPSLVTDPLGVGGELFVRRPLFGLCPHDVVNCVPRVAVQTAVILAGSTVGGIVLARRVPSPADRQPGMAALCLIVAGGIVAITAS
ncbi:MAG: hypothetical protein ACRDJP_07410 [Actinomycetota bacterium]